VKPIKVLIVEDSAIMRDILTEIISADKSIEVLGTAPDVETARRKIKDLNPDVITLDVDLPGMDGISFLEKIMRLRPTPVVMISGHTQENSDAAYRALEIGAVDVIGKSTINVDPSLSDKSNEIIEKIKAAARAKVGRRRENEHVAGDSVVKLQNASNLNWGKVVCIGASAGGVEAMRQVVSRLPSQCPPILYTQHMPKEFTAQFAQRLNEISSLHVCEAENQMKIEPGHIYLAPGDHHLSIAKRKTGFICNVNKSATVSGHRPSVDVLFASAARLLGGNGVGVLLTGMGRDGAQGLLAMAEAGAVTLGQDEATSLIYGMPRVAMEMGAVGRQVPLRHVPEAIIAACTRNKRQSPAPSNSYHSSADNSDGRRLSGQDDHNA